MTNETEERLIREFEDSIRRGMAREFERMKTEGPAIGLTPDEMEKFLSEGGK